MRVLIVDDEPLARRAVRNMLRLREGVEITGECEGGAEAVEAIATLAPDLVFLDVEMPEVDGFAVLERLGRERLPHVVFVTAYDRYAVRAFEARALDYLLKPFDQERFEEALDRAQRRMLEKDWGERAWTLLRESRAELVERFIVRRAGRVFFLSADEVDWIEAQGNYVNLHSSAQTLLLRETMGSLETRLDPRRFRRIHRSTIVNLDAIRELRPCFHGDYEVLLRDGAVLKLSHRFRENLQRDALGGL